MSKLPFYSEIECNLSDLKVDNMAQRALVTSTVNKIVRDGFDPLKAGVILISERPTGRYIIDGQNRVSAALSCDVKTSPAHVYTGLTSAQEAELFLAINRDRKAVSKADQFKVGLHAGLEPYVQIAAAVDAADWEWEKIHPIATLLRIGSQQPDGPEAITWTLNVVRAAKDGMGAWGYQHLTNEVLNGVAEMFLKHGDAVDAERLAHVLTKLGGSAPLIGLANRHAMGGTGSLGGGSRPAASYRAVLELYNRGLRASTRLS